MQNSVGLSPETDQDSGFIERGHPSKQYGIGQQARNTLYIQLQLHSVPSFNATHICQIILSSLIVLSIMFVPYTIQFFSIMSFTFTVCYMKFTVTLESTCPLDHVYPILMHAFVLAHVARMHCFCDCGFCLEPCVNIFGS